MWKHVIVIVMLFGLSGCDRKQPSPTSQPTPNTASGLSYEQRIVIDANTNHFAAIAKEYQWLETNYPGYQRLDQSLLHMDGHFIDLLTIKTSSQKDVKIYFDVTALFPVPSEKDSVKSTETE